MWVVMFCFVFMLFCLLKGDNSWNWQRFQTLLLVEGYYFTASDVTLFSSNLFQSCLI